MKNAAFVLVLVSVLLLGVQSMATTAGDYYVLARFSSVAGQLVEVLEVGPPGGYTCDGSTAYHVKFVGQITTDHHTQSGINSAFPRLIQARGVVFFL
jgi:hypothetical protein